MALEVEEPEITVTCDNPDCTERAIVQVGVTFACAVHAMILAQDLLSHCKSHFVKKSRQLF